MSILADRLQSVRASETKAMSLRAANLRAQGRSIITLSQGEPDFDTPAAIALAGVRAITEGRTRYVPVAGVPALRDAIRGKLLRDHALTFGDDQITVGCGAKQVIFNALFASLNPGDEVVVPAPCYVSHTEAVRLAGGTPVLVDCLPSEQFKMRPEQLERALSPRTRWLLLNSPSNPTGAVYSEAELDALAEVLERHAHVWVLSDDVYEKLVYGTTPFATMAAAAPELANRTLTVNGVSKAHAMTGWRVGYGAGPAELIRAMNMVQGHTSSHTSSIAQHAAVAALTGDQRHVTQFREAFRARRNFVVDRLNQIPGLHCAMPEGAFYVFASCAGLIGHETPSGQILRNDTDVAMYLLENGGVAVVPGVAFSASPYIRISYASSLDDLRTACDRIAAACGELLPSATER